MQLVRKLSSLGPKSHLVSILALSARAPALGYPRRTTGLALCTWSYPDDGEQLIPVYAPVAVHVVELEIPA